LHAPQAAEVHSPDKWFTGQANHVAVKVGGQDLPGNLSDDFSHLLTLTSGIRRNAPTRGKIVMTSCKNPMKPPRPKIHSNKKGTGGAVKPAATRPPIPDKYRVIPYAVAAPASE